MTDYDPNTPHSNGHDPMISGRTDSTEDLEKQDPAEIEAEMARDRRRFQFAPDITTAQHEASARLEWALRQTLAQRGMHGFAAHFMAVGEEVRLQTLPFLAAAKLLGDGYGFGGEGDATSAAAVCSSCSASGRRCSLTSASASA